MFCLKAGQHAKFVWEQFVGKLLLKLMFARKEKVYPRRIHIISREKNVFFTLQHDVVDFELLVECVNCIANALMLQPTPTLNMVMYHLS